jgi:nucleotide-binding universal stress UspA family protein
MSGRIVVGVDGSPQSKGAVTWALEEACVHGDEVVLVHAWEYPAILAISYGGATAPVFTRSEVEDLSHQLLEKAADEARARAPGLTISTCLVPGHPGHVLIDAAKGARLLVVGSRGLGGFKGLLMGSVSTSCAHHACCPVVIVPPG